MHTQEANTEQEDEEPEKLNRMQAAYRALQAMGKENGGTDTLSHLGKVADDLFVAGGGESDIDAASWRVQQVLEHLEGIGLVELSWECIVPAHQQ